MANIVDTFLILLKSSEIVISQDPNLSIKYNFYIRRRTWEKKMFYQKNT